MRLFFPVLMILLLSACYSMRDIQSYSNIDTKDKTITIGAGSSGIKGKVKKILSQQGWKITISDNPEILEVSSQTNKTYLQKYNKFRTRYTLLGESEYQGACPNLSRKPIMFVQYDISLVDNKTGSEVFTMNGAGCEDDFVEAFQDALDGKSYSRTKN